MNMRTWFRIVWPSWVTPKTKLSQVAHEIKSVRCTYRTCWQMQEPDEQEMAEFGYPTRRTYHAEM